MYDTLVKKATFFAICSAIFLILIKIWTWWVTDSLALFASLIDSSMDLFASAINFFLVRYALKPADKEHPFGHGKAESLSSLAQSAFITGSAIFLLLNSIKLLLNPVEIQEPELGIIVSIVSAITTFALISYQRYVISKTQSQAIRADMLHYFSDFLVNIGVIISMGLSLLGFIYADAIFALIIGVYILISAMQIAYEATQNLLDKSLSQEEIDKIKIISLENKMVKGVHDIKTRRSGMMTFVQMHVELDDELKLVDAHQVADEIELKIMEAFSPAEVIVHQDPLSALKK